MQLEGSPESPAEAKYTEREHEKYETKRLAEFETLTSAERQNLESRKSNSTSTVYVQSTISVPDVNRILLSVGILLEQMVGSSLHRSSWWNSC